MDTSVYPLSQLTQLLKPDASSELPAITSILTTLASPIFSNSSWTFTAGYFNPDPSLKQLLINTKSSSGTVVTASQWANGFYGSKGVSGLIPPAYTLLSRRFFEAVQRAGRNSAISVKEWRKGTVHEPEGWTYHAKGLWVTMPNDKNPSITLVGSSNYTKRSYSLDLEANALIVTKNPDLQRRLGEEQAWLQNHAKEVGIEDFAKVERRVSLKVRVAMWIVSLVGGAL
jgi:CDP-diacylglycerol---glycerol-3-phosphate 3-phosphatidyltransferase